MIRRNPTPGSAAYDDLQRRKAEKAAARGTTTAARPRGRGNHDRDRDGAASGSGATDEPAAPKRQQPRRTSRSKRTRPPQETQLTRPRQPRAFRRSANREPTVTEAPQHVETLETPVDNVDSTGEVVEPAAEPDADSPASGGLSRLEREGDIAADYLEGLLDIADLDGDIDMDVEGDRAMVSIVGADLAPAGRRERRGAGRAAGADPARGAPGDRRAVPADARRRRVPGPAPGRRSPSSAGRPPSGSRASGEPVALEPMTPFERKVVHDAVAAAGLVSESEGEEPRRYVVVRPA